MKNMTLREIDIAFGISRRAIQGYEKAGLVCADGKNERGHLLYNEISQKRIKQIRLLQQIGFTIKEIKSLIDSPNDILKSALENQIKKLEQQKHDTEILIKVTNELIKKL